MFKYYICHVVSLFLLLATTAPADIVWSGNMYQRTYHEVPAIDFNLDGANDFSFNLETNVLFGTYYDYFIEPFNGQIVVEKISETLTGGGWPLGAGTVISASVDEPSVVDVVWDASEASLFSYGFPSDAGGVSHGGWFVQNTGYLGVSFNTDAGIHYGWIEMSHDETRPDPLNNSLMIHGWAWETEVDTPILAGTIPEPSSGILTMVGSLALLQLARSRRRKQTNPPLPTSRPQFFKTPEKW